MAKHMTVVLTRSSQI